MKIKTQPRNLTKLVIWLQRYLFFVSEKATQDTNNSSMLTKRLIKTCLNYGLYDAFRMQSTTAAKKSFTKSTMDTVSDFTATKIQNQQLSQYNNMPLQLALTQSAADKLTRLSKEENNPKLALRLEVSSGGCHGFQYDLKITNTDSFKPDENDTMFERGGGKLLIDKEALEIMRDSKIDYVKELIGEGFKVIESPLTKSSCGCGSSFDVDFEKLENMGNKEKKD